MIAIDLGSNTLRVLEISCHTLEYISDYEKVVKTADRLVETGMISQEAIDRVVHAIEAAKVKINFDQKPVKAVTTEAVRRANNASEVLAQIESRTGIRFEMISGEEEAALTLSAVSHRLKLLHYERQNFVVVDIGGGSTELIFHYDGSVISRSFPIGIVTVAQTYKTLEKIREVLPGVMHEMQIFADAQYSEHGRVNTFVATAGTPTTVAAMKLGQNYATYDAEKINGTSLEVNELELYLQKLLEMPFDKREETVGTGRSDLIAAGILIFEQIFAIVGSRSCVVIDDGLREGVALRECRKHYGQT